MTKQDGNTTERRGDIEELLGRETEPLSEENEQRIRQSADRIFGVDASLRGPLKAGDELGSWKILGPLGAGGQAFVYRAVHRSLGRPVAIKVPRQEVASSLLHEARLAVRLEHHRIVRVEHIEEEGEPPFLVMEYCRGGSLEQLLEAHPDGLPVDRMVQIGRQILEGLDYAHGNGVIHRDLKPANVLFDKHGAAKISDLGIGALALGSADGLEASIEMTRAGLEVWGGTPDYMAPEQADPTLLGDDEIDGRADLFAFGNLLFQMLTGARPRTIRPPSRLRPELDPAWDDLVFRLLEEDRQRRFPTAAAVQEALQQVGGSATLAASPPTTRPTESAQEAETDPPTTGWKEGLGKRRDLQLVLACSAAIVVASFLHWGTIAVDVGTKHIQSIGNLSLPKLEPLMVMVEFNAWNGYMSPFGVRLPHWLVVVAGVAVGLLAGLRVAGRISERTYRMSAAWLCVLGLVQILWLFGTILFNDGSGGVGLAITFGALLVAFVSVAPRPHLDGWATTSLL